MLAELAVNEPATFAALVATAKAALLPTDVNARPRQERPRREPLRHRTTTARSPHRVRRRRRSTPDCSHPHIDWARARKPPFPARARGREAHQAQRPAGDGAVPARGPAGRAEALAYRPGDRRRAVRHADGRGAASGAAGRRAGRRPRDRVRHRGRCSRRWPTRSRPQGVIAVARQTPTSVKDIFARLADA